MKFKDIIQKHLLTEGRTRKVDFDFAKSIYKSYCNNYYKSSRNIYRSITGFKNDFGIVEPSKANKKRVSRNTKNFTNLFIDNSSMWSEFPDRGLSIICSSASRDNYILTPYIVIPFNNAKFGICPKSDIWFSFSDAASKIGSKMAELDAFNSFLGEIIGHSLRELPEEHSYSKLTNQLKQVKLSHIEDYIGVRGGSRFSWGTEGPKKVKGYMESNNIDNLFDLVQDILDPNKNGFKLGDYNDVVNLTGSENEVWTESSALVVKKDKIEEFLNEV